MTAEECVLVAIGMDLEINSQQTSSILMDNLVEVGVNVQIIGSMSVVRILVVTSEQRNEAQLMMEF